MRLEAEAKLYAQQKEAEGVLYAKQREAEGTLALFNAQASGLKNLFASLNNDPHMLAQYLMLEKGTYERLAKTNAEAVHGMQPKITVWNTGPDAANGNFTKPISDIMRSLPPLLTTIHDQTGMKPAEWLMDLAKGPDGQALAQAKEKPEQKV